MLYHPKRRMAFICHPRTASHSTADVLYQYGFVRTGNHHSIDEDALRVCTTVACTVRDPMETLLSWWRYKGARKPFPDFMREDWPSEFHVNGLFYGYNYADTALEFDDLERQLSWWLDIEIKLPHFNKSKPVAYDGPSFDVPFCIEQPRPGRFHY